VPVTLEFETRASSRGDGRSGPPHRIHEQMKARKMNMGDMNTPGHEMPKDKVFSTQRRAAARRLLERGPLVLAGVPSNSSYPSVDDAGSRCRLRCPATVAQAERSSSALSCVPRCGGLCDNPRPGRRVRCAELPRNTLSANVKDWHPCHRALAEANTNVRSRGGAWQAGQGPPQAIAHMSGPSGDTRRQIANSTRRA